MTYVESVILQNATIRQKYDDETGYQRRLKKQHEDIFNKIEILKIINTTLYVIYNILTVPLAYTLVFVQGNMFIPYRIAILVLFVLYPFVILTLVRTLYVFGRMAFAIMTGTPFSDEKRTPLTHFGDYPKSISNIPFTRSPKITIISPSSAPSAPAPLTATGTVTATAAPAPATVPRAKSSYTTEVISSYLKLV
jgi:hypothetical protein